MTLTQLQPDHTGWSESFRNAGISTQPSLQFTESGPKILFKICLSSTGKVFRTAVTTEGWSWPWIYGEDYWRLRQILSDLQAGDINTAAHVWCFYMFYVYIYECFFLLCVEWNLLTVVRTGITLCKQYNKNIIRTPGSLWLVLPSGKPKRRSKQRTRKSKGTTT